MRLNGAEIIIKLLEMQGISNIAGIPGGANLPLYDALNESKINHILVRHEQAAAFIAQGITRSTGEVAVCFATSGPGATNLLTAIADAKLDSIPIIAITGQVPYSMIGTDAFQEVDTYGLTLPITKHNYFIRSVEELFEIIPEAFSVAKSGRPGPVVIDIPKDIQLQEYEFENWPKCNEEIFQYDNIDIDYIKEIAEEINKAERPILYVGGGIISSGASEELYRFAKKNSIPVAVTLMGIGCIPNNEPLYIGMLGMHGARYTNLIMEKADLILAFGVRFDDRATGNVAKFCSKAKTIHIDIDEAEINKVKSTNLSITGDIGIILNKLYSYIESNTRRRWMECIEEIKVENPFIFPNKDDIFHPINIIRYVSSKIKDDSIICTDVGQHQMWTAQAYPFKYPRTLLTSGGLGTMGFGLPAAIGAALANPHKQVICFSGDGSILMNIQELATLADLKLNLKIIILNNGYLGMVRQQQEMLYNKRYVASKFETNPDFATIAKGFGINSCDLGKENNPLSKLSDILGEQGAYLINVPIKEDENVLPIVLPGAANTEMIGGVKYEKQ